MWIYPLISLGYRPRNGRAGPCSLCVPRSLCHDHPPTADEGSSRSLPSSARAILSFLHFRCSNYSVMNSFGWCCIVSAEPRLPLNRCPSCLSLLSAVIMALFAALFSLLRTLILLVSFLFLQSASLSFLPIWGRDLISWYPVMGAIHPQVLDRVGATNVSQFCGFFPVCS